MTNTVTIDLKTYNELYAKAKMYDEHTCDKPLDVNINIELGPRDLLKSKEEIITKKAKVWLYKNGGLL
ncbi:hypothetical protein [Staphylococcus carnosus]|uniref:hypothetical protein n=1 Tax=Staphylococcus carnosus TaxID=1281 RepID=UPI00031F10F5|nr:hypothetical protein [Staphylococcus carnosus]QPT03577.1 hypothetical protein I6G40_10915 [Staphylococcus carnosus]UQA66300.1 hypothetical protein Sta3580_06950 [Staphylococcus carnosus]UTB78861.1 hypothetical protein A2I62_09970 [Staphylococcus carnosus]UTB88414.1 hypothetical protein A2I63_09970 [Staphylococcus carnosus]UTB90762.1 hypothetical protein A2I64_09965 [Staphylococcus carnosus]